MRAQHSTSHCTLAGSSKARQHHSWQPFLTSRISPGSNLASPNLATWRKNPTWQPGKNSYLATWQPGAKFLPGNLAPNSYLATWQPGKSSNLDYLAVAATWPEGSCCCQVENTRRVARLENLPGCRVAGDSIESRVGKLGQGAFCQVGGLLAPRSNLARFWQPGCRVAGLPGCRVEIRLVRC